ncbi:MAG: GNAT family N-acetyltransferase [Victivallaceae bacterium]|nr:GNAT family N-acetyltransferase [Victivallaceae bacterium]
MNSTNTNIPCACQPVERTRMIELVDAVMREGIDQTFLTDYPLVYQDSNLQNIFTIQDSGEMASVVPYLPRKIAIDDCNFTIGIISPTATSINHRKKGYASKCLGACIDKMIADDITISILWTENVNFHFYGRSQFQVICSQDWLYKCTRKDAELFADNGHQVEIYNPESQQYLTEIQAMHEKEICGVQRASEEYPLLFNLPKSTTLIALQDNRPVGYLMFSKSVNKPGIVEAGGDKAAVETLVNRALFELNAETEHNVYANLTPTVLGELFEDKLSDRRFAIDNTGMMIRLNDTYGFMQKIAPFLEQKNGDISKKFSVKLTDRAELISFDFTEQGLNLGREQYESHIELSSLDFVSIIFGAHPTYPIEVPEFMQHLFPFYFPIWQLDHS